MKITLLNGNQDEKDREFEKYISRFWDAVKSGNHEMTVFPLREMKINYCTGCWNCWLKTPGICVHRDDAESVYRDIIRSDLLLFASPLRMGFVTALTKKMNERLIPLLLPYVDFYKGECHHFLRYGKPPLLALLLQPEPDTDEDDMGIVSDIYRRTALNFRSSLQFVARTDRPVEEAMHEINSI